MRKFVWSLFLFLLLLPSVKALNPNYKVTGFYIKADVLDNGDVLVEEQIVLKGAFNGYMRDLSFRGDYFEYDATDLELVEIWELNAETKEKEELFTEVFRGQEGASYVYEKAIVNECYRLKMYRYNPKGTVVFAIKYILKDVVLVHNDIAELYWTFIGSQFDDDIDEVVIKINLPEKAKDLRAWAHGPLTGEIDLLEQQQVVAQVNQLAANTLVDIRVVFDATIVPKATKFSGKTNLKEILVIEEERAAVANQERQKSKIIYYGLISFNFLWLGGLILIIIYVYRKHDKEWEPEFKHEYYRELPAEYGPEVVEYLLKHNISTNGLTASLLNIVQKKGLTVEQGQKRKDYILIKAAEREPLSEPELFLRDWLLHEYGDGKEVHLSDIKKAARRQATAQSFIHEYEKWQVRAISKANEEEFYEDQFQIKLKLGLYFLLGIILYGLNFFHGIKSWTRTTVLLGSIIFIIYIVLFKKKTKKGNEHYRQWQAFKKFLSHFGRFKEKELPEIVLWEKYLVYATVFGIAKKVSKAMSLQLKNMQTAITDYPFFFNLYITNSFATDLARTLKTTNQQAHNQVAKSNAASGGGFGGGFSSGGGFGGGGTSGGGRGF